MRIVFASAFVAAATTAVAPEMSGRYAGTLGPLTFEATMNPSTQTLSVSFNMPQTNFCSSAVDLSYDFDGKDVKLVNTPAAAEFLSNLPGRQTVETISIVYDANEDQLTASLGRLRIVATKQ
jgi:hypothetical protein